MVVLVVVVVVVLYSYIYKPMYILICLIFLYSILQYVAFSLETNEVLYCTFAVGIIPRRWVLC